MVRAPPAGHTGYPTPPVHATREVVVEIGSELRRVDTPAPRASSPATMRQTAAHLATSRAPDEVLPAEARAREEARVQVLQAKLSLTADRLDTGADWRVLAPTQAHHRSRLSDFGKHGNALRLSSVHNAALPAR